MSIPARSDPDQAERLARAVLIFLLLVSAVRLFLSLNVPLLFLHTLVYDDGLFMRLAINLARGAWLGHFDQLTLVKGPGYPTFLAVTGWFGIPLSAAHGLFQILALAITGWAVGRLTSSWVLGALVFLVLAIHPAGFLVELHRVVRDQIYWAQTLLIFSLFAVLFLAPPRGRATAMVLGGLAGSILGWAWLTREEGLWFLPGLSLLFVGATFINRKESGKLVELAKNTVMAAGLFLAVHAAFMTGNRIAYGSFVGVDVKERNFVAALNALQTVDTGSRTPYVSVPLAARSEVAENSSLFEPLAASLTGALLAKWGQVSCGVYKETCGDIAGGWFLWALRDAAAANGFYQSPQMAAQKFGQIAEEITTACSDGRLRCRQSWVSYLPAMAETQWLSLPRSLLAVATKVAFLDPQVHIATQLQTRLSPITDASRAAFEHYWAFLNYPRITQQASWRVTARGWYYDSQSVEWPVFKIYTETGEEVQLSVITRIASPDLQKHFSDDRAGWNRWEIAFRCPNACTLAALTYKRPELRLPMSDRPLSASLGTAQVYLDSVSYRDPTPNSAELVATYLREILVQLYRVAAPILLSVGLLAALAAIVRNCTIGARQASSSILLAALAAWALVATRIGILALIDASSFPAANFLYAAPAIYLAAVAALLSIAALLVNPQPTS